MTSEWEITTLGKLADYTNGRGFKKSEWRENGVPIIRIQNLTGSTEKINYYDGQLDEKHHIRKGDLLLSWAATLDVYEFNQEEGALNQHIFKVIPKPKVNQKFLYYLLKNKLADLYAQTHGSGMVHITAGKFKSTPTNLPSPEEQENIVTKIEELFSEIDSSLQLASNSKAMFSQYKLSLLSAAYSGKLSDNIPVKIDDSVVVNDELTTDLPEIPNEWKYVKLKCIGELTRGKSKHRPRNDKRLFGGPYPFIQTGEVKASGGLITEYTKTYSEFGLSQSKLWPKGTLCITIAANIAETAFLDFDGCFPDSVVGFTANQELVHPKYVKYFIELSKEKIERFAPATAQKNINLKTLEELVIPLCSPEEQLIIVNEIESLFSEINNLAKTIPEIKTRGQNMKQSILSKAFKGELL